MRTAARKLARLPWQWWWLLHQLLLWLLLLPLLLVRPRLVWKMPARVRLAERVLVKPSLREARVLERAPALRPWPRRPLQQMANLS